MRRLISAFYSFHSDATALQFSYVSDGIDRFLGPRTVTLLSNVRLIIFSLRLPLPSYRQFQLTVS
jgi:hypothetical protein